MAISSLKFASHILSGWGFLGDGFLAGSAPEGGVNAGPDGRAKKLNTPAFVKVVVFDRVTLRGIASTVSSGDGTWRVNNLDASRHYFVIGFDPLMELNAAIQDWVKPHVQEP